MRVLKLVSVLLVLGAPAGSAGAQENSCGESAAARAHSVIDRSLFRVTAFDEVTNKESLLGTATLVTLHQDPADKGVLIGHFITASHIFEGDGSLPKPGKRFTGVIGLRPCSSRPNEPESGVSGATEIFHRDSLQEPDLSVLKARVDMDLFLRDVIEAATLFVGTPKSIRFRDKTLAYSGFPANAADEITPFSSSVTDIRYIPELKRPWALMGVTKTPDEGQSGSPLFDYNQLNRSLPPIVFGVVVEVPKRDEVTLEELAAGDQGWVKRAIDENSSILVQPIEFDSPILRLIPPGSWVQQALDDIRRKDPVRLATRLRQENVKQPVVDFYYFLKAMEEDKVLAMSAALYQTRISTFINPFSFDTARKFLRMTHEYVAAGIDETEVRAFTSAELGRSRLREIDACLRKTPVCAQGATERQINWMREEAIDLIAADVNRVDVEKVTPGTRSGRYLANLHLDLAKLVRQVSRGNADRNRNEALVDRSLHAAVTLDPKGALPFDYLGTYFTATGRPVTAGAALQLAATNAENRGFDATHSNLRERCIASMSQWKFLQKTESAASEKFIREETPGLHKFMNCVPPKDDSERRFELMQAAVNDTLALGKRSGDVAGKRAEKIYSDALSRRESAGQKDSGSKEKTEKASRHD